MPSRGASPPASQSAARLIPAGQPSVRPTRSSASSTPTGIPAPSSSSRVSAMDLSGAFSNPRVTDEGWLLKLHELHHLLQEKAKISPKWPRHFRPRPGEIYKTI